MTFPRWQGRKVQYESYFGDLYQQYVLEKALANYCTALIEI